MERGWFIVFEGTEGTGKSTQVKLLVDRLRSLGMPVVTTREPGGTAIGERIRELILSEDSDAIDPRTEALLHTAARAQHVADVIRPALERGEVVISDRFADSTLAYQGGGQGLPIDSLLALQRFATHRVEPDIRVFLDLPVEIALERRHAEPETTNRIDRESIEFHRRVESAFRQRIASEPDLWVIVDGTRTPEEVAESIWTALQSRIPAELKSAEPI